MIEGLPFYVSAVFVVTTLVTIWLLVNAARPVGNALPFRLLVFVLPLWLLLTGYLSTTNFYRDFLAMPPRVVAFAVVPALLFIAAFFVFFRTSFVEKLSLNTLTLLHIIRVPVELVLLWLFHAGQVPQVMTFEGWNFDILSGMTAPLIWLFAFRNGTTNRRLLIVWNLFALGLLVNIVSIAIMSFQGPFQRLAFDQPNVAVTYLPFIWLPAIVVPIVLFAHLAALWQLLSRIRTDL